MLNVKAELERVFGGARAIATMVFDDGLRESAKQINALCKKHSCRASLMLCSGIRIDTTLDMWRELFSEGYLHPESHSHLHKYLTRSHPENLTEEIMTDEIEGSFERLNKLLPGYDILTFGLPYGSYASPAMEHLYKCAYAVRAGNCVLADERARGKMQSLDPVMNREEMGSWYNMIGIRMMPEKCRVYPMITPEALIEYLDKCVESGGWFLSTAHGIVEGENLDITVGDLDRIMQRMEEHTRAGNLWVTSFTDATKYVRERQSSCLELAPDSDNVKLTLKMQDKTADGLPLDGSVFNMPLTVRLTLPEGAKGAELCYGEKREYLDAFDLCGAPTVRFDMLPNTAALLKL